MFRYYQYYALAGRDDIRRHTLCMLDSAHFRLVFHGRDDEVCVLLIDPRCDVFLFKNIVYSFIFFFQTIFITGFITTCIISATHITFMSCEFCDDVVSTTGCFLANRKHRRLEDQQV